MSDVISLTDIRRVFSMGDQQFEQSVKERILTWKFQPVADTVGELSIKYPFEFAEEEQ